MGRLGQLFPLPWVPVSHKPCILGYTLKHKSQSDKSNGSAACRPGLKPVTCGVRVQCFSGMLHRRHHGNQCNCFSNNPFPKPFCRTVGSNHRPVGIKRRRPEAGPAPSPPRPADLASNPKSNVTRVLSAFQVCSLPMQHSFQAGGFGTLSFLHGDHPSKARTVSTTQPWGQSRGSGYLSTTPPPPHAQSHHPAPSKMRHTTTVPKDKICPKGTRYLWTTILNQPTTSPWGSNLPPRQPRAGCLSTMVLHDVVIPCPPPSHQTLRQMSGGLQWVRLQCPH